MTAIFRRPALAVLVIVSLVGCGSEPSQSAVQAESPATGPERPEVTKFKESVNTLLEESRVMARTLREASSLRQVTDQQAKVEDCYARLPDIPPNCDPTGDLDKELRGLSLYANAGSLHVKMWHEAFVMQRDAKSEKLKLDAEEFMAGNAKQCEEVAAAFDDSIAKIKAMLSTLR